MLARCRVATGSRRTTKARIHLALLLLVALASAPALAEDLRSPAANGSQSIVQLASIAADSDVQPLFRIERSKNTNVVQYDARVTPTGHLDRSNPVDVYWVKVDQGGIRKELDWIERRLAYGFSTRFDSREPVLWLDMAADIGREIAVRSDDGQYRAEMTIDGRTAVVERVYVESVDTLVLPRVVYVDLYGRDIETGEPLNERLLP